MKKSLLTVGDQFYRNTDDGVLLLRIIKIINQDKVSVLCDGKRFNISHNTLVEEYTKLKPHGTIYFSIVELQDNNKDVIISFFRREDEGKLPYAVCRQNIENVFMSKAKLMDNSQYEDPFIHIGVSISQDTCPEDIPFNMMLVCNDVKYSNKISIYLDDTFDNIVALIPRREKYDAILKNLYDRTKDSIFRGVQSSVEDLMGETIFMQDILSGFNIKFLDEPLVYNERTLELDYDQRDKLQYELNIEMYTTYVVPFDYTININEIKRSYVLVKDITETVYIIAYDKGDHLVSDMNRDFIDTLY